MSAAEAWARAEHLPYGGVLAVTTAGFLALYVGLGGAGAWLARRGRPLGAPVPGQVRREVAASLRSVAIFGAYGVLTVWLHRTGVVPLVWRPRWALVPVQLAGFLLFNELHFYGLHRALHTPWLYRAVHRHHHRSVHPTVWSTFSFHPLEAVALGSVTTCATLLFRLDAVVLLLFPAASLAANVLGHLGHDLAPGRPASHPLAVSRRHAAHHARGGGNFGFLSPTLDRVLGTALPDRAP